MKQWQGLPSMEAVLNALKHAVNPAQEGNDPNYKKCYLHVIVSYSLEWCIVHLIVIRLSKSNEYQIKE